MYEKHAILYRKYVNLKERRHSAWSIVKTLIDKGPNAANFIQDLLAAVGSPILDQLQSRQVLYKGNHFDNFFGHFDKSKYSGEKSKVIQTALQKMTKENMFAQPRMRLGLSRLMWNFRENEEISQLIEDSLVESGKYTYIPEEALLWRHNGRFIVEYFWRQNITQKITLYRNNQIITVSLTEFVYLDLFVRYKIMYLICFTNLIGQVLRILHCYTV